MALRHRHPPGACRRANRRTARARPRARPRARARARTFPASFAPRRPARGEPPSVSFLPTQLRRRQLARQIRARYLPRTHETPFPLSLPRVAGVGRVPSSERISPITSLTYDEYKNNVSTEIIHGRFAMLGVTGAWAQENLTGMPWFYGWRGVHLRQLHHLLPQQLLRALLRRRPPRHHLPRDPPHGRRRGLPHRPPREPLRRRRRGLRLPGGRFDPLNFSEGKEANFSARTSTPSRSRSSSTAASPCSPGSASSRSLSPPTPRAPAPTPSDPSPTGPRTSPTSCTATSSTAPGASSKRINRRVSSDAETWRASDEGSEETSARARAARAGSWRTSTVVVVRVTGSGETRVIRLFLYLCLKRRRGKGRDAAVRTFFFNCMHGIGGR